MPLYVPEKALYYRQAQMKAKKSDSVPQYYSKNKIIRGLFWDRLNTALGLARLEGNISILDIGAGTGELIELIVKRNPGLDVKGIDIKLHTQDKKLKKMIRMGDVTKIPFNGNEFDVVFALDILEHIRDLKKAIMEIKRVLKNDGVLIVSAPSENLFYKICRFLEKGTTSSKEADSSEHYHNCSSIRKEAKKYIKLEKEKLLPFPAPFNLFNLMKFRNVKD